MASHLLRVLNDAAAERGFDAVGTTAATPVPTYPHYERWIDEGRHGRMGYMARDPGRRADPSRLQAGTRSLVVLAANHRTAEPPSHPGPLRGRVARYAWNRDYHDVLKDELAEIGRIIEREAGGRTRAYVDTGAILERDAASRAGIGFVGKNSMLIRPGTGSHLFLGEVLTTAELEPNEETVAPGCGTCRLCLDACPTGAITEPNVVDARKCISYLTIELKGPIPRHLRRPMGRWIFGCDICQDCCPWNARPRTTSREAFQPADDESMTPRLPDLLALDDAAFRARFRGTALMRPKRRGLLRNACVALGNEGHPEAVPALMAALGDPEPLVRGHAAWAVGEVGSAHGTSLRRQAVQALEAARAREEAAEVREEIQAALSVL